MSVYYRARTAHSTYLCIRRHDGVVVHASAAAHTESHASPACIFVSERWPGLAFILSDPEGGPSARMDGYNWDGAIAPFKMLRRPEHDVVCLSDPATGLFLCATPPEESEVIERREDAASWEEFSLEPEMDVSTAVEVLARQLDDLADAIWTEAAYVGEEAARLTIDVAGDARPKDRSAVTQPVPIDADTYISALEADALTLDTSQMLGRLMPRSAAKALADSLGKRSELERRFAQLHPGDVWAEKALPALSRWLVGNGQPLNQTRAVGPDTDRLTSAGLSREYLSLPMLVNGLRRASVASRKRLCVLTTARNEGLYLIEWIAHHRALGADHFFIYSNDNTDGSDGLLDALCEEGVITTFHNRVSRGDRPQYKAYGHALQLVPEILDYDWVATIDLDEYINFNGTKFASFLDYVAWQESSGADSFGLSWRMFGPSQQVRWSDRSVYDRFPNYEQHGNIHIKSVFKPALFIHSHAHFPFSGAGDDRRYRAGDRRVMTEGPFNEKPNYDFAWIDHFHAKSIEEFLTRRMRNRGDGFEVVKSFDERLMSTGLIQGFLDDFRQPIQAREPTNSHIARQVRAEVVKLMAIASVADAVRHCVREFAREVEEATSTIDAADRFHDKSRPEGQLSELLRMQDKLVDQRD